jgi:catechol 2,3-dioxygenase-like lactoylglutathione lyase family enzyme
MDYKLEVVVVPVSDVDRAKHFYAEMMGFAVDVDHAPNERFRVVQLTPTGSGCSVTIGKGLTEMAPGSLQGLQLVVDDIAAAHAELSGRGVPVSSIQHHDGEGFVEGPGERWNSFVFFKDPDGNSWAIQERPADG